MLKRKLTDLVCKKLIKDLARKLNVDAKLITTRLMSEDDKNDMRNGNLPLHALEAHITVWIAAGLPDYAHGSTTPLVSTKTPQKRFNEDLDHDPIKRILI